MKNSTFLIRLLIVQTLFVLSACVGTVQNTDVPLNSLSDESKEVIPFAGLDRGHAISHDKIELIFTPAGLGDPNLKYLLYINGSQSPIEISPDSLDDTVGGAKRYMLEGLNINTEYKFQLRLHNALTNAWSQKERVLVIRTFDNRTADFKGVTSVKKVTGLSSTEIKVDWVPARMDGVIVAKEFDPTYYEITIIGPGGPQNLNNENYVGSDRRVIPVPDPLFAQISPMNHMNYTSKNIDSLQPNTTYYVQVRAVNKLYHLFASDPSINDIPVDREVNTKFLKIKTDPATGAFEFNRDSLSLSNALGDDAFTKVNAFWSPGSGTFTNYRIFLRKYANSSASEATVLATDLLDTTTMENIRLGNTTPTDDNGRFINVTTDKTSYTIGSLSTYQWYQFRIVQCKTIDCPVDPIHPDAGIVSELRAIRVQPSLAPFDGITRMDNPKDALSLDEIKVHFDPPSLTTGYADKLEVYCVEPSSVNGNPAAYVFDPNPLGITPRTGSSVPRCNGLYLDTEPALSANSLFIKGVKSIPSDSADNATYCFAVFPAIRYQAEQVPAAGTYPTADWAVRCITPEVRTPSISQFAGLTGSCNPVQDTIGVTWKAPTGGIYATYRLFYRSITGNQVFRFSDAVAGHPDYQSVSLADGLLNHTITGLRPGTRYRMGLLTEITVGSQKLYSEYNTSVKDCVTPMPVATFKEWTRVFAIGPKVDGRFPHGVTSGERVVSEDAKILEALNVDGIPYELELDSSRNIQNSTYVLAPGHYHASYTPTGYYDEFDGAYGTYRGVSVAASQNGIVSLGWRDVTLDFLQNEFEECQRHPGDPAITTNTACSTIPASRTNRQYGYKVYRSDDNRLTWKDVTGPSGASGHSLVYARIFNYRKRPNLAPTTDQKMAFFTDYSVKALYMDPEGKERGRILWYKIVPYFEKKPLTVAGTGLIGPNMIKVVLPPPNMALVKREMANRNACLDIGREDDMDTSSKGYYSCPYNGLGSRPKGVPWEMNKTVVDMGGDLLVDRYELGCQFTRGDFINTPENGASHYMRIGHDQMGAKTDLREFKGMSTDINGIDTVNKFVGCTAGTSPNVALESDGSPDIPFAPDYKNVIYGDCIGKGSVTLSTSYCSDPRYTQRYTYRYPGAYTPYEDRCEVVDPVDPTNIADRFTEEFRRHLMVQSEFAAVFFHRDPRSLYFLDPLGPGHVDLIHPGSSWDRSQYSQCQINLAAVGSDGKLRARWFPVESLNRIKDGGGLQSIAKKSISEVMDDPNLYDGAEYRKPDASLVASGRFDLTTRVSRIATANSSKLPPITGISQHLAQEFCSSYEIEVGVSTDGSLFLPTTLPMPKRLLRRPEMLAGARWPLNANNSAYSYDYSEARIRSLEGGGGGGMCHNENKDAASGTISRNDEYRPVTATWDLASTSTSGKILTGSSDNDTGTLNHTSKCISEFGLQDMVGNVAELSTERIFCDYSKDKLYFGQYNFGSPILQNGAGSVPDSIEIPDRHDETVYYWKDAVIRFEQPDGSFREVGTVSGQSNVAWAHIDEKSGYCSVVDSTEAYSERIPPVRKQRFRDASDIFHPVFLNGGTTVNSAMISRSNPVDQDSVNYLRNGDGYFLNFGWANLAPLFQDRNALAITDEGITAASDNALGPFFNPITGFPVSCGTDSCLESEDNERVTTPFLATKLGTQNPAIRDFPIGNSQIYNTGISDIVFNNNTVYTSMDLTTQPYNNDSPVFVGFTVYQNGSIVPDQMTIESWWLSDTSIRSMQEFTSLRFALPRGTEMIFTNGGNWTSDKAGRFTASTVSGSDEATKTTLGNGFRCGVMINSD